MKARIGRRRCSQGKALSDEDWRKKGEKLAGALYQLASKFAHEVRSHRGNPTAKLRSC